MLILAIAASLGWQDHQRFVAVREHHAKLVTEAASLGIALDSSNPAAPVRVTKRERENREADAKLAAAEFIAFAKEMEAMEKKGGPPDEATMKRIMEFMDRMMSLDSAQLKILIAEVRANKELKDETRQGLIGFSIMTLASDHPQAALALFTESSDLFKDNNMSEHVVSSSLAKWAKDDPMAALEWVRKNGEKFPDLVTDDAKRGMISGTAANDPKLAFTLIGELGIKSTSQAISSIAFAAKTPAERTTTLAALRDYLVTLNDEQTRSTAASNALSNLASGVARDGFDAGSKWIATANLSQKEMKEFTGGLTNQVKAGEAGRWVEWIGEAIPHGEANGDIRNLVRTWTENDYQAAGKWLATAPDGPAKNTSIRSYAETVSKYDSGTATQWAMTLPPGEDRDETLKHIHENWPKDDEAAKDAFAKEHGIK